jgi:hypothetical protein
VARDAIGTYARADWRATGIDPEVFWRDMLEWSIHAEDYGLLNRIEVDILRHAGVGRELDSSRPSSPTSRPNTRQCEAHRTPPKPPYCERSPLSQPKRSTGSRPQQRQTAHPRGPY